MCMILPVRRAAPPTGRMGPTPTPGSTISYLNSRAKSKLLRNFYISFQELFIDRLYGYESAILQLDFYPFEKCPSFYSKMLKFFRNHKKSSSKKTKTKLGSVLGIFCNYQYKMFRFYGKEVMQFVQQPGEVLYLPHGRPLEIFQYWVRPLLLGGASGRIVLRMRVLWVMQKQGQ